MENQLLKKISENFYCYLDKEKNFFFTLNKAARGVAGKGKAWYFSVTFAGHPHGIAIFTINDDGYFIYREDYKGQIWKDENEIVKEANEMISKIVEE